MEKGLIKCKIENLSFTLKWKNFLNTELVNIKQLNKIDENNTIKKSSKSILR